MDRRSEQAASADAVKVREGVSVQYGLPARILVPTLDPLFQAVDDNTLFPISDSWSHRCWARVSNLRHLMRSCFSARKILEDKTLMLFVMPYISLKDAYDLHGCIENTGSIWKLPVWGRHGLLSVSDPDGGSQDEQDESSAPVIIKFFVINYGLLQSKSQEHIRFASIIDDMKNLGHKVVLQMNQLLKGPALSRVFHPEYMDRFENAGRIAQEEVVLSLYMQGLDPHDYISDLDTDVHDRIYDPISDPCENPNAPAYEDMPEEAKTRLEEYMDELMITGRQVRVPKEAELEALAAEGNYDAENVFARGSKSLDQALCNCSKELQALIDAFNTADCRYSLIGVKGKRAGAAQNSH